jgi:uncharacterized protein YndB with AHSA1/START domain
VPIVLRTIEIKASRRDVWRWLATPDGLRRWFSPSLEIDLQVGGAYRFFGPDNKTWISGTVLELTPEDCLVLSWMEEERGWIHPKRLSITLAPTEAGTRVTLVHDGFAGIGKPDWRATMEDYQRGANEHRILEKLAALVSAETLV